MPELGPYGSVRGARGDSRPYRESRASWPSGLLLTPNGSRSPSAHFVLQALWRLPNDELRQLNCGILIHGGGHGAS